MFYSRSGIEKIMMDVWISNVFVIHNFLFNVITKQEMVHSLLNSTSKGTEYLVNDQGFIRVVVVTQQDTLRVGV